MIKAADRMLARANDHTKIIPGHGEVSGVKQLQAYRDMLETVRARMQKLIDQGRSRDQVIAAGPTKDLDAEWGGGFLGPDRWVGIVYDGMTRMTR